MNKNIVALILLLSAVTVQRSQAQCKTIVLDLSSSTWESLDRKNSLLDMELELVQTLLNQKLFQETKWGITAFAGDWCNICAPILSCNEAENALKKIDGIEERIRDNQIKDGTAIYSALFGASIPLSIVEDSKSILLFTDGSDNCSHISSTLCAKWLQEKGICVDVVALTCHQDSLQHPQRTDGTIQYVKAPVSQDFSAIEYIAKETNGTFFKAYLDDGVEEVCKRITQIISQKRSIKRQISLDYIHKRMNSWLEKRMMEEECKMF